MAFQTRTPKQKPLNQLSEHTLPVYERIFPTQSAVNALADLQGDTSAQAIANRARMGKKERFADDKLNSLEARTKILTRHSSLSIMLANGYLVTEKFFGYAEARDRLMNADRALTLGGINLSVCDDELCDIAEEKARVFELKVKLQIHTYKLYLELCQAMQRYNIEPPTFDDEYFTMDACQRSKLKPEYVASVMNLLTGALNRMACPLWWRRRLRSKQALVIEQLARDLRTVHKKSSPYISEFTIRNKRERKSKSDRLMSDLYVVPEGSNPYRDFETLHDVAARSSSSGYQLASELMVRIRGFEECAKTLGHRGEFYTLTAPSRFHSVHASGIPNHKYNGSTPNDAQEYFNELWKRARAQFAKQKIRPYGFRVVEPHHDGCPHWHMLLFFADGQAMEARKILRKISMQDTPSEVRTSSTRFKAIAIDPKKGSAAGYIAKYITKAVTGSNIESVNCSQAGEMSVLPADAAERASTWASTFNIRRFQQIGGPSVTTWRELRKLGQGETGKCEVANSMNTDLDTVSRYALEKVRAAADASDWAAFCIAMGGVQVKRKDQTLRIHYQISDIVDRITGEISRSESKSPYFTTKYGDVPANRILGVAWDSVVVITRRGTSQILTEKELSAQRKIMAGVSESIESWIDDGRYMQPSEEEMAFLESCAIEDYQNMCLFMDYEALGSVIQSDEVATLDLCH
ncbi:replication endonuclease [Pseudoalteromonas rubra]|uniref:replication endonuclease n=1 Tax=Pseudoalteromonas rubra TaxID=43658 RepID=UPI0005FA1B93|nr:replication endonuclease [Pseudoalteromonas rubra]